MPYLFTRNGASLPLVGADALDRTGQQVGRRVNKTLYDRPGRYADPTVEDRVVYRSPDAYTKISAFATRRIAPSMLANRRAIGLAGTEPFTVAEPVTASSEPPVPFAPVHYDEFDRIIVHLMASDLNPV